MDKPDDLASSGAGGSPPPGRIKRRPAHISPLPFALVLVVVGVVAGLGAVVFRGMISVFHNLLFLGQFSWVYDANQHTPPGPWGPWVILVPVVGALLVAFLVKNFAPEAKGHGVPEVIDAIYYAKGVIRPLVAMVKSLASALSIGSGGSVGREGPIIQIGASFGSSMGQVLGVPIWQRNTLIAAGAAAGIAATFNTPVGGILFAVELLMVEISVRTLVPVTLATVTATYVGQVFFGAHPSFVIPALETPYFQLASPWVLASYIGLGLAAGAVATGFIRSIYGMEDLFEKRVPGNYYTRHALGMLLVGLMLYAMQSATGQYYVEGVGYAAVQDVLGGAAMPLPFLMLLLALKLLATSLTLGSGASGGIFSPSIFIGATLGGGYGILLNAVFLGLAISPAAFAVAGMAGVVGGATGAALAAIVMIFEMTLDYSVIIPMTITVAVSYGTRKFLLDESVYTLKLARRGHRVPQILRTNVKYIQHVKDLMDSRIASVDSSVRLADSVNTFLGESAPICLVVREDHRTVGVLSYLAALARPGPDRTVKDAAARDFTVVHQDDTLYEVLARMHRDNASMALVTPKTGGADHEIVGVVTKPQIADALVAAMDLFSE